MRFFLQLPAGLLLTTSSYGHPGNIEANLSNTGFFLIKNNTVKYLTIRGDNGKIIIPNATSTGIGVIYKEADPFLHDYRPAGADGKNIFLGVGAGNFTMTAPFSFNSSHNSGVGYTALAALTTGSWKSSFGAYSLSANTTGENNSAISYAALQNNTTGSLNAAYGRYALHSNNIENNNCAFGTSALASNSSGNGNTVFGYTAGQFLTTGSNNIVIGNNAQASTTTVSNEVTLGNSSNNSYRMYASGWTFVSDARYKHNIKLLNTGLEFIKQLRPVEFVYNNANNEEKSYGFIVQEVKQVVEKNNLENISLVQKMDAEHLGLKTTDLIPVLTKAVQEQQAMIESEQKKSEELRKQVEMQQAEIKSLKADMQQLMKTIKALTKQ